MFRLVRQMEAAASRSAGSHVLQDLVDQTGAGLGRIEERGEELWTFHVVLFECGLHFQVEGRLVVGMAERGLDQHRGRTAFHQGPAHGGMGKGIEQQDIDHTHLDVRALAEVPADGQHLVHAWSGSYQHQFGVLQTEALQWPQVAAGRRVEGLECLFGEPEHGVRTISPEFGVKDPAPFAVGGNLETIRNTTAGLAEPGALGGRDGRHRVFGSPQIVEHEFRGRQSDHAETGGHPVGIQGVQTGQEAGLGQSVGNQAQLDGLLRVAAVQQEGSGVGLVERGAHGQAK